MSLRYLVRRLGGIMIVLWIITIISFSLVRLSGGNPARLVLSESATDEDVRKVEIQMGLDRPVIEQYIRYLGNILRGDLGKSYYYNLPVVRLVGQRLPFTARVALPTVIFACCLCIPLGVTAGSNRGKPVDFAAMFFALLGQSMSTVWLALFNVFFFSVWLGLLPTLGADSWKHYILPILTLGYPMAAEITRVTRSGMIDTLGQDYITATLAKGVSRRAVNWKYALRNAMIPVATLLGMSLAGSLSGSVVVEVVYGFPGMGQLLVTAVNNRDYNMVQSLLLISAFMFTIINLIVDIINSFVDPRLKLE